MLPAAFTALGEIDDHEPLGADQYVELRQITVGGPNAQHAHDLLDEEAVILTCGLGRQLDVAEPWGQILRCAYELYLERERGGL